MSNGLDLSFENSDFDVVIIWAQTFGLFYGEENQQQFLKGSHFYPYPDTDCYYETFDIDEIKSLTAKADFCDLFSKEIRWRVI